MDIREQLLNELQKRCREHGLEENEIFTAASLSETLQLSRNTVSQYLNEFVKKGVLVKINSRPVYFFDKKSMETVWDTTITQNIFSSFEELEASREKDFEKLIGYQGSLQTVVEHCKAAVSYPDNGLPVLLYGATGSGKSFLAALTYQYALHHKIVKSTAKFITVNCAEYANNPELLTANLFGYVKGAYTGAEENQEGLLSLANEGVLFLDEVHCLEAKCQEKLFQYMDKGIYHKVGDNEKWYRSNCRLIFATTENPQTTLLKTLLRRIPITVVVPSLKERPLQEKRELIYSMFMNEKKRIQKDIFISNLAFQTLLDFTFVGNVGEMENSIKAICAGVFVKKEQDALNIHFLDLPSYFFKTMKSVQMKTYDRESETMLPIEELHGTKKAATPLLLLYERILGVHKKNDDFLQGIERCRLLIQNFIDYMFFKEKYNVVSSNEDFLLKMLDKIYSIIMNKYSLAVSNNQIKIYSKFFVEYTKNVTDAKIWIAMHQEEVTLFHNNLQDYYPRAYRIANEVVENVELNLDVELDEMIVIILTLSFIDIDQDTNNGRIGLILCHGYSTASSISDTANHMLGSHVFDGIDMELRISIDKIVQLVDDYLKQKAPIQELMLLVDMGSLEKIYEKLAPLSDCNIGLINRVSTATALEAGNMMKQGRNVKAILEALKNNNVISTHFIEGKKRKEAILTVCATGFGTAKKISELIITSLPRTIELEVIPYDYQSLLENGLEDMIFSEYNVQLMVGTLDPEVKGIPYMAMKSIMTNDEAQELYQQIGKYLDANELEQFSKNIMKNFTLSNIVNHLTILNAEKVMEDVEDIVTDLEELLEKKLSPTTKVGLYVHISCLIERMILRQEITTVEGFDALLGEHGDIIMKMKHVFSGVEMRYSVEVPYPEMYYILNYFKISDN